MSARGLGEAWQRLREGDAETARLMLIGILQSDPRLAEAHRLLGMAYRLLGAPADAETAFKAAIHHDKKDPAHQAEYAAFLEAQGRTKEAERAFRAALAINRRYAPAAVGLAHMLTDLGRPKEALQATTPLVQDAKAAPSLRSVHARALKEDLRFGDAEAQLRLIVSAHPFDAKAQQDLAELVWMRTGDPEAATATIDAVLTDHANSAALRLVRAKVLTQVGRTDQAVSEIDQALALAPDQPALLMARAKLSGEGALEFAQRAVAAQPRDREARVLLCEALLASGEAASALEIAEVLTAERPLDQFGVALLATACRLTGDPRYADLHDYERLVHPVEIEAPKGWSSLSAYLSDLTAALTDLHRLKAHPFDQSVRGGSQVTVINSKDRVVSTFPKAIDGPIREVIERLKASGHPYGQRARADYRVTGMWSVRLRTGGHHDNHVHPEGWLSSACYISLPRLEGQEGWFTLGEPGVRTRPTLSADKLIEPKPGRLVLFPSYMWHGTVPFTAQDPRLTIAFDLVPQ